MKKQRLCQAYIICYHNVDSHNRNFHKFLMTFKGISVKLIYLEFKVLFKTKQIFTDD